MQSQEVDTHSKQEAGPMQQQAVLNAGESAEEVKMKPDKTERSTRYTGFGKALREI